jgi:predicted transcriptional regulator
MASLEEVDTHTDEPIHMATEIISAYVRFKALPALQLSEIIRDVHRALSDLGAGRPAMTETAKPAVPVKKSVTPDYLVCLEDGKKLKMLKRYLRSHYGLSPEEYRAKWRLPPDYPMVAPNYARQRSEFAKEIGLGRKSVKRRGRRKTKS